MRKMPGKVTKYHFTQIIMAKIIKLNHTMCRPGCRKAEIWVNRQQYCEAGSKHLGKQLAINLKMCIAYDSGALFLIIYPRETALAHKEIQIALAGIVVITACHKH